MRSSVSTIQAALAKCKPVMLVGKHGTGQFVDAYDALRGLGLDPRTLFLPAMCELCPNDLPLRDDCLAAQEAKAFREADSFILVELDGAIRVLQDEVRHFLATASRQTVVIVHDETKLPEDVKELCTVLRDPS
jgi:hypothetical protein